MSASAPAANQEKAMGRKKKQPEQEPEIGSTDDKPKRPRLLADVDDRIMYAVRLRKLNSGMTISEMVTDWVEREFKDELKQYDHQQEANQ